MKPDWKDSPWPQSWRAVSKNGYWWFFSVKPEIVGEDWYIGNAGFMSSAGEGIDLQAAKDWKNSLEKRPEK